MCKQNTAKENRQISHKNQIKYMRIGGDVDKSCIKKINEMLGLNKNHRFSLCK